MLKLMDLLTEGVNDKGNFKAVFMAGGPGSGKSFIAAQLFGIPETTSVSVSGLSVVNSDRQFKMLLKKYGFDPTMLRDYEEEDPYLFKHLSAPAKAGGSGLRDFAQALKDEEKKGYMAGKRGMLIDSTGSNFKKVRMQKAELEKNGYDCYMVFVMTSLETAQRRNIERGEKGDRVLPANIVKRSWQDTRKNLGGLKALFGSNFALVHNDKDLEPEEIEPTFRNIVKNYANKWVTEPVNNPIAKQWVKDQLKLQKVGGVKGVAKRSAGGKKRSKGIGYK